MIWMEIRCDERNAHDGVKCHSHQNSGPMDAAANSHNDVKLNLTFLFKCARKSGWVKRGQWWLCPAHAANAKQK